MSAVSGLLELIGVGWSLHIEIGSLIIFNLPDVIPDLLSSHDFSDSPALNQSTKPRDHIVLPSREIEGLLNEQRSDALSDEPATEDFLDFCCTRVDIELKHVFPHRLNVYEAFPKAP